MCMYRCYVLCAKVRAKSKVHDGAKVSKMWDYASIDNIGALQMKVEVNMSEKDEGAMRIQRSM